ncbi:TVP38/TMEM64 family protein [Exiguobacterium sp. SH3S2]|uniref:TVP38/TMEM64 family protein n=1 Tax=unclassified Exiguobacterium TaxID=2644629 RepID=UPI00035458A9|nr:MULTISPECIES: TVP38/TMEM64 family protein [unclassified Exiguobacterium]EPE63489.1 SNARE associated Golgi family protein [Exiguobacterium sp. S17]TCI41982.1 TVP38/TMEM64 family protein [Exiguobacterium sp. SH3S3]TCI58284.1 TVP38/TMEM64 family protein [Exiguobacterium sp. SH3S2]
MPRPLKISLMLVLFGTIFYITHFHYELRPSDVRDIVLSFGWWGPLVFFLIYAIGPLVFLPTSVLSLGAGLAFGVWPGVLYILFGATAAAVTGYVMARLFGRSVLKVEKYPWSEKLFAQMEARGFLYVFVLRLIPLVSFDLLSYAGGIAKVRFKSFLLATVLGMIPGTLAYSFLGASLASGSVTTIFIAALVFISLLGVTYYFRNPVKKWLGLTSE